MIRAASPRTASPDAGRDNLLLLVQLRWIAVAGQLATIVAVHFGFGVELPLVPMLVSIGLLALLNLLATGMPRRRAGTNLELFCWLLTDVAVLTSQLFLSGGAHNPFITLYLLQVVLGAILLESWSSWMLVAVTSAMFAGLGFVYRPLPLPAALANVLSGSYLLANWFNYTLAAVLLVFFVTRSNAILRDRDARLAELRQRAVEEEHIVRMGLLASGAAHELGTPLSTLSVALGDWRGDARVRADPSLLDEVVEMQAQVTRCKDIVAGVLFAAGEASGVAPERTTVRRFLGGLIGGWQRLTVVFDDGLAQDLAIVADRGLAQALVSILDNAAEAGAGGIRLATACADGELTIAVEDDGQGFPPHLLAEIGHPYRTSKARRGAGLGLFLATNVLRTLGGTLVARNRPEGGATVTLTLPVVALALDARAA